MAKGQTERLRFEEFELDAANRVLRKNGAVINLPRQPFTALRVLASRPGELVTREDLRQALWGDETVVDFDHGLNTCIRQIRAALGEEADSPRIIETVPRMGYRFKAEVEPAGGPRRVPRWAVAAVLLAVAAAGTAAGYRMLRRGRPTGDVVRVAVLPFVNADGEADSKTLGEGLAEDVIARLGGFDRVEAISRTSAFAFRGKDLPLREIGERLNAGAVVTGSVRRSGGMLEVGVRLVELPGERELWSGHWVRPLAEVFAVQSEIAWGVGGVLRLRPLRSPKKWPTENPQAYLLYLRGRSAWDRITPGGARAALELFEQAAALDPAYAQAHAGIADAYLQLSFTQTLAPKAAYPRAARAAERALALDESLPEAHLAAAWVKSMFEWDWGGAERAYRRAIELDPNNAVARAQYGVFLSLLGRFEEAVDQVRRAESLDPLSPRVRWEVATVLYYARRFDEAIEQCRRTLELDPNYGWAYHTLGQCYAANGRMNEAIQAFLRAGRTSGVLGHAYAAAGRTAEARQVLAQLEKRYQEAGVGPGAMAMTYIGLGDADRALEWLEKSYAGGHWLGTLKVAPVFDPLRGDPRFQRLLEKVGLARIDSPAR